MTAVADPADAVDPVDRPGTPHGPASGGRAVRLPTTDSGRQSLLALAATLLGVIALVPGMPSPLSALLLVVFVGVGPGCALLAWFRPPPVARIYLVPALGLSVVVIVTAAAAWTSWWSPHALFGMIALVTEWSVLPNLRALVRDMAP